MIDRSMSSATSKDGGPMSFNGVICRDMEERFLTEHCTVCRELTRWSNWWLSWLESLPGIWAGLCFFQWLGLPENIFAGWLVWEWLSAVPNAWIFLGRERVYLSSSGTSRAYLLSCLPLVLKNFSVGWSVYLLLEHSAGLPHSKHPVLKYPDVSLPFCISCF